MKIGYLIRVSSEEKAKKGESLHTQRKILEKCCKELGAEPARSQIPESKLLTI